jgi:hypothetical protein
MVLVFDANLRSLLIPKSIRRICPNLSIIIFSGLRSLYMMFISCKYSKATIISEAKNLISSSDNSFFYNKDVNSPPLNI